MFKSKRFIAFMIGLILFTGLLLLTNYPPIELATSVTMLTGIYIGADTIRKSESYQQIK
jgi:hypothetical protein